MKLASLLLIVLSNQGYWFGGQEGTINVRVAARGGLPAADFSWDLMFDRVKLAGGIVPQAPGNNATVVHLIPPECRQRISLRWVYRLVARGTGQELDRGEVPIQLFPDDINAHLAQRLGAGRLWVWDDLSGIPALLNRVNVPYTLAKTESQLQFAHADVLLVGSEVIDSSPFSQFSLMALARAGTSVMVFKQSRPQRLLGYDLSRRDPPSRMEWRSDHPLLRDFQLDDLQSWIRSASEFQVIELPAGEPALELCYYSPEISGMQPVPIDALLLTRTVGAGRLVLCQIPLGDWVGDPRSQMLMRNAIDYLLTRPNPTPPPGERLMKRLRMSQPLRTIPISPGSQP